MLGQVIAPLANQKRVGGNNSNTELPHNSAPHVAVKAERAWVERASGHYRAPQPTKGPMKLKVSCRTNQRLAKMRVCGIIDAELTQKRDS